MRSAVTLSLVPEARGGPFVFWDDLEAACRKARELGFDGIEIFPPDASSISAEQVRPSLEKYRLKLAAIGSGGGWVRHRLTLTSPDSSIRVGALEFIRSLIDAAGELGAPVIVGSMQGRWGDAIGRERALEFLTDALDDLGNHAFAHDVPLFFEPLNRYETNLLSTLPDAVSFIRSLRTDNVKVLGDLFHMNIEETDVASALKEAAGDLGHVHLADSNRRPAGCGHTDFAAIAQELRDIDYDGYLSAECFAWPDSDSAAQATIEAFRRHFGS